MRKGRRIRIRPKSTVLTDRALAEILASSIAAFKQLVLCHVCLFVMRKLALGGILAVSKSVPCDRKAISNFGCVACLLLHRRLLRLLLSSFTHSREIWDDRGRPSSK